ncbi:hypothetical protein Agub_g2316 [Astrephomene gubernaculifera]|uniref:Uncharacterized protein n=1 Tax=Astrephomene gubernaculifera TaxID=47775 RepID=A0AAD3DHE0_9CHLO|nr:hypothetical protein Agub_g2316 [Astrephomene gubernaculifera]
MRKLTSRLPSLAPLCFFLISVAYKLAWTAISSLLSQYSKVYGPGILLQLNVAYFFPSIPVLMLQTAFNDRMDRRLGLPAGALLRLTLGLGGLVGLTRFFPVLTAGSERALLATTVLVGMSYGIAFGTSYQVASKYASGATVALTTGFVSSGPVVLLLDLALKRGPYYSPEGLETLFKWVAGITAAGLAAAAALVLGSWRMLAAGGGPGAAGAPPRVEIKVLHRSNPSTQSSGYGISAASGGTSGLADKEYAVHASERSSMRPYVRHRNENTAAGTYAAYSSSSDSPYAASGGVSSGGPTPTSGTGAVNGFHNHRGSHGGMGSGNGHHAITLEFADAHGRSHAAEAAGDGSASSGGHHIEFSADESKTARRDLPLLRLAARILPAATAISISVGTSMLIFPFFTFMHSTGLLGIRLPQVLFYIRLVGDIAGRMVPRRLQVTTVRRLMLWAAVKLALVPLLFGCIFVPHLTGGDVGAMAVVAVFWVLSGYLNTCSYLVAPTLVPPSQKARASGLMTVAFQSACFGALLLAAVIQQLKLGEGLAQGILAHGVVAHAVNAAAVEAAVVGATAAEGSATAVEAVVAAAVGDVAGGMEVEGMQ